MSTNASQPSPTEGQKTCRCAGKLSIVIWIVLLLIIGIVLWVSFTESGQQTLGQISNKGFKNWLLGEGNAEAEKEAAAILEQKGVFLVKEQDGITSINFTNCPKPDDATVKQVANLFRLLTVNLSNTEITDDQLAHFGKLKNMTSLVINGTPITDAGLAHVSNLPALQSLQASHTKISDDGLDHIVKLKTINILDLSNTGITDKGLKKIAQLKNINWLLIRSTKITDVGLAELAAIPELKHLTLSQGMSVSNETIEKLKQALPKLMVDFERAEAANPQPAAEETQPAAEETQGGAAPTQPETNAVDQ